MVDDILLMKYMQGLCTEKEKEEISRWIEESIGAALGVVGIASYAGAAVQDLISGFLIQSGKAGAGEAAAYDFSVASWFWVGAAVLSVICTLAVWKAKD